MFCKFPHFRILSRGCGKRLFDEFAHTVDWVNKKCSTDWLRETAADVLLKIDWRGGPPVVYQCVMGYWFIRHPWWEKQRDRERPTGHLSIRRNIFQNTIFWQNYFQDVEDPVRKGGRWGREWKMDTFGTTKPFGKHWTGQTAGLCPGSVWQTQTWPL